MKLKIVAGIAAAVVVLGVKSWFVPGSRSSSFSSIATENTVSCEVTHDGFLYRARRDTFDLGVGESFSERFGPHDVHVAFVDEVDRRGLEISRATRNFFGFGGTSSTSIGNDSREKLVTTGLGVGTLVVDCTN